MVCAGCGFELSPGFAFCPRCGKGVSAAEAVPAPPRLAPEVDRRQVTVLFADVTGFTTMAERLDPEEVRAFQDELLDVLAAVIARHDGFLEKFVGDAVLAVFGAPVAHEDDPERALHAALDMVEALARSNEGWVGRLGQPVSLHIGVHTGPVVAGHLGRSPDAAYAVTGDTVNTTARLLAAASGAILVSEATHALTHHRFAFEQGLELALRGKAMPVLTYRLVGLLAAPDSGRGLAAYGLASPMVGRDGELAQLLAAFERVQAGHCEIVDLCGEPGAGKSRLVAEFLGALEAKGKLAGGAVRHIACSSRGEPTYGVFGALFREGYRLRADDTLASARGKLMGGLATLGAESGMAEAIAPMLGFILGMETDEASQLAPEQLKRQITLAARLLIEQRLDQGHLIIVVEDLHWADAASLTLLCDVAGKLSDRRLLLVLTHRPDVSVPPHPGVSSSAIRLASLSQDDTGALVAGLFGAVEGDRDDSIRSFVAARSGGNPLFVEEIVRSLVSRGVLVRHGQRWARAAPLDATEIPSTLQGLLLSRVDRLPVEARRLLQEAAVLGMIVPQALLAAVATEARGIDAVIQRLVAADLLCRDETGDSIRFVHALVQEAVYQNLLLARRTELHERAGRALESAVGTRPERLADLEALGRHWSLSADKARGASYLVAAGDWARAVYANDDAIRHYERALRTLEGCPGSEAAVRAARERLADLLALTERRTEAAAHYDAVREEFEAGGDLAGAARLHRKRGGLYWESGEREQARACLGRGLLLLGDEGYSLERAQLLQETGRLAFRGGDNAVAIAWAQRALVEADREKDAEADPERLRELAATRAHAYNTIGVALARAGRPGEAVGHIEESVRLAEKHDLLHVACRGYTNLGVLYSSLNPQLSIGTCLRGLETARKVGDLGFQSHLYANLAVSYCALTDRCEADGIKAARMAVELDRRLGLVDHLAAPLIILGQIHQCRGEQAEALACYEEALGLAERTEEPQFLFPCYDGLGTLHLDAGNRAFAALYLAKSDAVCQKAGLEPDALMVLPFLC